MIISHVAFSEANCTWQVTSCPTLLSVCLSLYTCFSVSNLLSFSLSALQSLLVSQSTPSISFCLLYFYTLLSLCTSLHFLSFSYVFFSPCLFLSLISYYLQRSLSFSLCVSLAFFLSFIFIFQCFSVSSCLCPWFLTVGTCLPFCLRVCLSPFLSPPTSQLLDDVAGLLLPW